MSVLFTPPRLARAILRRAVPRDSREAIDGDLTELYARRRAAGGDLAASAWYLREATSLSVRFLAERLRSFALDLGDRNSVPSALDFRLGARMLMKQPGLTLVGGLGIAVATAMGAGAFAFFNTYLFPDLPLNEGDRIVSVVNWNAKTQNDDDRVLADFIVWRKELKTIDDLGAFRTSRRNLIDGAGQSEPISVAEMSPSGFRVARVPALMGRSLIDDDERPGAPPVVVIGYDAWQTKFQGDRSVVGQSVRIGRTMYAIVGVMPAGFEFPVNHQYWIPFRPDPAAYGDGRGPELQVFGRLAPGVTKETAQAELTILGRRAATVSPSTHATLEPRLVAYTNVFADGEDGGLAVFIAQAMLTLLLIVVCVNVAILVYARTVTRSGEIAVRTALGATRGRIVTQLFAEALVLSGVAAVAGLGLVAVGLRYLDDVIDSQMGGAPFWIDPGISASTVFYACGLAILGAVVVGVLPALRATGSRLRISLGALSGGTRPQLGRTWTMLVVAQVAVIVAVLPPAVLFCSHWVLQTTAVPGFAAHEYLTASLLLEREGSAYSDADYAKPEFRDAMRTSATALVTRLAAEPTVAGATFAHEFPGAEGFKSVRMSGDAEGQSARLATVGTNFFDVFEVPVVLGRGFRTQDGVSAVQRPVIVNRSFINERGGTAMLGRRIYLGFKDGPGGDEPHEVIGVVEDFPASQIGATEPGDPQGKLYLPAALGDVQGATIFVRARGADGATIASRVRAVAAEVDPTLQLRKVQTLQTVYSDLRRQTLMSAAGLVLVVGSVFMLAIAGVYSLMAFTVAQRRREIGIRAALGGDSRRILASVIWRAGRQVAMGAAVGLVLVVAVDRFVPGGLMEGRSIIIVPLVVVFMGLVALAAAAGPARRGLRIQPTEALRSE